MRALRKYLRLALLTAGLLAAIATAAIATGDDSNPPSDGPSQVTAIEPRASEAMAVLARSRAAGDAIPAAVATKIDERSDFGMNPDLSRLAIGNATNSLYVIPANGHVCAAFTLGDGANLACPTTEDVAAGVAGAGTVTIQTGDIGIYGLAPDGVDAVSVQVGTSESIHVAVQNNAYYTVVPAGTPLRSVRYTGPSGPVEFPIYDPAGAFEG